MLIGIDASRAATVQRTGTEAYAYHLIKELIALAGRPPYHCRLRLYFNQAPPPNLFPSSDRVEQVLIPFPRLWSHLRLAWELHRRPPDLFFTPAHVIPFSYRGKAAATVHDLGYHFFPESHTRRQVAYLRWSTRHNARRAGHLLADSEATKNDLVRLYKVNPDKVTVVYPALPDDLQPVQDETRLAAAAGKYGLTPPYLLYIGTLQPRKNLARLVEAFAALPETAHQLVLAGKAGWLAQSILDKIRAQPAGVRRRIILTGYVADEDKAALISGATALLFPSLYEGFGFPILEGQACGTPVLAGNLSSLPEVAGDGALLVNPLETPAIATAIHRLIHDADLRRRLIQQGFTNCQRFSWSKTAAQALRLLTQI